MASPIYSATLQDAATACGYIGFNWQQVITNAPCPAPVFAAVPANLPASNFCPGATIDVDNQAAGPTNALTVGPRADGSVGPPIYDPPKGGYTYLNPGGPYYDPYPYYYDVQAAITPGQPWIAGANAINLTTQLLFSDGPIDACLDPPGPLTLAQQTNINAARAALCGGGVAPSGSYLTFTTYLVGINPDQSPGPPLYTWNWFSSFNGPLGTSSAYLSLAESDPKSGIGSVTVTSINGVPVPPIVPPSQVATTSSGLAYSRVTKTFNGTVTITNIGGSALTTPTSFHLVLNSLPPGVTLANSSGTFNRCPYITIPALMIVPAGQSVTVALQFSNPSNATIDFTPEFYAGSFQ